MVNHVKRGASLMTAGSGLMQVVIIHAVVRGVWNESNY